MKQGKPPRSTRPDIEDYESVLSEISPHEASRSTGRRDLQK